MDRQEAFPRVTESDIRRSAAYQTMKLKASQAFVQINDRLEGMETSLGRRLEQMEAGSHERLRLLERGQSGLLQSFEQLHTWRGQFNKRLGEIETVLSAGGKPRVEPPAARSAPGGAAGPAGISGEAGAGTARPPAQVYRTQPAPARRPVPVATHAHAPVYRALMVGLSGLLAVGSVLFAGALLLERRQPPTPAVAAAPPTLALLSPAPVATLLPSAEPVVTTPAEAVPSAPPVTPEFVVPPARAPQPLAPRRLHRARPAPLASRPPRELLAPHRVQGGETWYTLARRHGVTPEQLMRLNNARPERPLLSGETIRVPGLDLPTGPQNLTQRSWPLQTRLASHPRRIYGVMRRGPETTTLVFTDRPSLSYNKVKREP